MSTGNSNDSIISEAAKSSRQSPSLRIDVSLHDRKEAGKQDPFSLPSPSNSESPAISAPSTPKVGVGVFGASPNPNFNPIHNPSHNNAAHIHHSSNDSVSSANPVLKRTLSMSQSTSAMSTVLQSQPQPSESIQRHSPAYITKPQLENNLQSSSSTDTPILSTLIWFKKRSHVRHLSIMIKYQKGFAVLYDDVLRVYEDETMNSLSETLPVTRVVAVHVHKEKRKRFDVSLSKVEDEPSSPKNSAGDEKTVFIRKEVVYSFKAESETKASQWCAAIWNLMFKIQFQTHLVLFSSKANEEAQLATFNQQKKGDFSKTGDHEILSFAADNSFTDLQATRLRDSLYKSIMTQALMAIPKVVKVENLLKFVRRLRNDASVVWLLYRFINEKNERDEPARCVTPEGSVCEADLSDLVSLDEKSSVTYNDESKPVQELEGHNLDHSRFNSDEKISSLESLTPSPQPSPTAIDKNNRQYAVDKTLSLKLFRSCRDIAHREFLKYIQVYDIKDILSTMSRIPCSLTKTMAIYILWEVISLRQRQNHVCRSSLQCSICKEILEEFDLFLSSVFVDYNVPKEVPKMLYDLLTAGKWTYGFVTSSSLADDVAHPTLWKSLFSILHQSLHLTNELRDLLMNITILLSRPQVCASIVLQEDWISWFLPLAAIEEDTMDGVHDIKLNRLAYLSIVILHESLLLTSSIRFRSELWCTLTAMRRFYETGNRSSEMARFFFLAFLKRLTRDKRNEILRAWTTDGYSQLVLENILCLLHAVFMFVFCMRSWSSDAHADALMSRSSHSLSFDTGKKKNEEKSLGGTGNWERALKRMNSVSSLIGSGSSGGGLSLSLVNGRIFNGQWSEDDYGVHMDSNGRCLDIDLLRLAIEVLINIRPRDGSSGANSADDKIKVIQKALLKEKEWFEDALKYLSIIDGHGGSGRGTTEGNDSPLLRKLIAMRKGSVRHRSKLHHELEVLRKKMDTSDVEDHDAK